MQHQNESINLSEFRDLSMKCCFAYEILCLLSSNDSVLGRSLLLHLIFSFLSCFPVTAFRLISKIYFIVLKCPSFIPCYFYYFLTFDLFWHISVNIFHTFSLKTNFSSIFSIFLIFDRCWLRFHRIPIIRYYFRFHSSFPHFISFRINFLAPHETKHLY